MATTRTRVRVQTALFALLFSACTSNSDPAAPDLGALPEDSGGGGQGGAAGQGGMGGAGGQGGAGGAPCVPEAELCDGLDNDCDGVADNGFDSLGDACAAGEGECRVDGIIVCADDGGRAVCDAVAGPGVDEACDGQDNDCDGATDEALDGDACSTGVGACATDGQTVCVAGEVVCDALAADPEVETCNSVDDDCDGVVDEVEAIPCYEGADDTDGRGACRAGLTACSDGVERCDGQVLPMAEACDAADNDCDGQTDEAGICDACGDGEVTGDESCDDGNLDDGDGCDANCQFEDPCGDGELQDGEICDDGNRDNGDGCDGVCSPEVFDIITGSFQHDERVAPRGRDTYRFHADGPSRVRVTTTGEDDCRASGDTILEVLASDDRVVATNDDAPGRGLCSSIDVELPAAGDYVVVVRGIGNGPVGAYTLDFLLTRAVEPGGRYLGATAVDGDDLFEIQLAQERNVLLMTGPDCRGNDTTLELLDSEGVRLEFNDDGGGSLCSRIERVLPAGAYRVVLTGFARRALDTYALYAFADPDTPMDRFVFASTHNSYSGGQRGSVVRQLDEGVRLVEFDLHEDAFEQVGDLRLGHGAAGDQVALGGGNPASANMTDWLELVAAWSDEHPGHAPISVVLDIKDNLANNNGPEFGNLGYLNVALEQIFGRRLFRGSEFDGDWPSMTALRGRIIVVLSGHEGSRRAYRIEQGNNPAVAVDRRGRVIEVHASARGELWYWTGRLALGGVTWRHHGRFGVGLNPAVAIDDDGMIVEMHTDAAGRNIWSHIGQLRDDLTVEWAPAEHYDTGTAPSVRFSAPDTFIEVHLSENTGLAWSAMGRVDRNAMAVAWPRAARTNSPRYDVHEVNRAGRRIAVRFDGDSLVASVDGGAEQAILYEQLAFVEAQQADHPTTVAAAGPFRAAPAASGAYLEAARRQGLLTRQWGFVDGSGLDPASNFPATDAPFADWYRRYLATQQVAR